MPRNDFVTRELAGKYYLAGNLFDTKYENTRIDYNQLVWGAEGHYGFPGMNTGTNIGGSFLVNYDRTIRRGVDVHIRGNGPYSPDSYKGRMFANVAAPWGIPEGGGQNGGVPMINSVGATAYNKLRPDRPEFSAFNAIFELREFPSMLMQRFAKNGLKDIGDYHLALEFGWKPLLRDVVSAVQTQMGMQKRLAQLIRDEGRPVRRRVQLFAEDRYITPQNYNAWNGEFGPSFVSYFYNNWGNHPVSIVRGNRHLAWASARMRYWLPPGPRDVNWTRSMKESIFGLYPSPAQVWKAIPWSWLVDWFANVGDLIESVQTTLDDRLAADYFYVMYRSENYCRQTSTTHLTDISGKPFTISATSERAQGYKMRLQGDPFGWGTKPGSLSGSQLAILGALGLSKVG
jgi:hypothetical protein